LSREVEFLNEKEEVSFSLTKSVNDFINNDTHKLETPAPPNLGLTASLRIRQLKFSTKTCWAEGLDNEVEGLTNCQEGRKR